MPKKSKRSVEDLTFSAGFVGRRDLVWILSENDEVATEDMEHTKMLQFKEGRWGHYILEWGSVAICGRTEPTMEVVIVGVDGEYMLGTPAGFSEGSIDDSEKGPENVGYLRDARYIGMKIFAVGMARQAYRRDARDQWTRIDDGLRATTGESAGLESVDGFHEADVYAVGLTGEIWRYNGKRWTMLDSPTNLSLNRVRCTSAAEVFACGTGGVFLRGRTADFQVIEQDVTEDNLYGLEWFNNQLFLASLTGIFVYNGEEFAEVDLGLGKPMTAGHLHANDGVLWSFGAKHLAWTEDGEEWTQVFSD